jgi:hypothetical protein
MKGKNNTMKQIFIFLFTFAALASAGAVEIVKNGKAAAEIALPEKPVSSVKFAAEELQKHIRLMSGVQLPLTVEKAPRRLPNRIHVGYGAAPRSRERHAWRVKATAADLYLNGNDKEVSQYNLACPERTFVGWCVAGSGSLLSVYDFLDRELQFRWLRPGDGGIFCKRSENISVKPFDRESAPRLMTATFSYAKIGSANLWHDKKFAVHHSLQTKLWSIRHRFVNCNWFHTGHAFGDWWKRYGKKHPEYFSLLHDGTRRPLKGDKRGIYITMCVSSPALMKQMVENYKQGYGPKGKFKEKDFISICENDTPGMCTCKGCRAWDMPEFDPSGADYWAKKLTPTRGARFSGFGVDEGGSYSYTKNSLSDRYARFWLETQKALSKINPKVTVMGYAYLNTVLPPRHVKLHSKIMVGYVGTPFFPLTREKMAQTRKEWDGWAKTGCVMQFRPNTTWSGGVYPLQYWRPLAAEYRRILQKPETKMAHFDTFRGEYANMGPMWYVLARLTARPDLTVEEVADEYFGSFGKAGPVIREYFDFWEKLSDSVTEEDVKKIRKELGWGINVWNNWDICVKLFTPAHFAQGAKILKKAEQIAATKWEKENVRFFQLGLEHARLAEITAEAHFKRAHNNTPANQADFDKKYKTLLEFRKRHERSWISNMGHLTAKEAGGFRRSVLKK